MLQELAEPRTFLTHYQIRLKSGDAAGGVGSSGLARPKVEVNCGAVRGRVNYYFGRNWVSKSRSFYSFFALLLVLHVAAGIKRLIFDDSSNVDRMTEAYQAENDAPLTEKKASR